jgi:hypothetical protein
MGDDTIQPFRELTAQLWALPIYEYLASEDFSRFCSKHDLGDPWIQFLELSRDKPDLYGGTVIRNAFSLFLYHIFHSRPEEFLHLFCGLLVDFSGGISCELPVDGLKKDLLLLGYPERELDHVLFILRVKEHIAPEGSESYSSLIKK